MIAWQHNYFVFWWWQYYFRRLYIFYIFSSCMECNSCNNNNSCWTTWDMDSCLVDSSQQLGSSSVQPNLQLLLYLMERISLQEVLTDCLNSSGKLTISIDIDNPQILLIFKLFLKSCLLEKFKFFIYSILR